MALAICSYAIVGIGVQYSPNFAAKLDGSTEYIAGSENNPNISLNQHSAKGLQGGGVKIWIDAIPVIDIEAAINLQFCQYDATLDLDATGSGNIDTSIALEVKTGLPYFRATTPVYGKVITDLSVQYPFLKFPPAVKILKIYIGAGVSYIASTPILDQETAREVVGDIDPTDISTTGSTAAEQDIIDAFAKKKLDKGMGGHVALGARLKPPVVPIAVFIDGKLHLGGGLPDAVTGGFTLEMGVGLAF
jgi:hypothetical protein